MNTAKTAAIWIKSRREVIFLVLSLENFRIAIMLTATIRA